MSAMVQQDLSRYLPRARSRLFGRMSTSVAPRKKLLVSEWADANRKLSSKEGSRTGEWRTSANPPLKEPMDSLSARSPVHQVVLKFPIQFGKSIVGVNFLGYTMTENPGPFMIALPGEVSHKKYIDQKLNPAFEETPSMREALSSSASRESSNRREFKDFKGGQLYVEHAGSPVRLKMTTVRDLVVDEIDEFVFNTHGGDDPVAMLDGRTSGFPANYKRLYTGTPTIQGLSRIDELYEVSDQREFHVSCPHCQHEQPLEWAGLHYTPDASACWYVCRDCAAVINEHHKTVMIANGRWVPKHPERKTRGYTINCLYYAMGLGPRWLDLVLLWRAAQGNPAKLKTFVNDRLAQSWEDPAMRAVKHNVIADRAETYAIRVAPRGVMEICCGVDTQDNRLAVQTLGFGPGIGGMCIWTLDYVELPGDPANEDVWLALTDLLNRPIAREDGGILRPAATAIDAGGHRTEYVKHYVRNRHIRRPLCIFGAVPNNAPVLSKGKLEDVTWKGKTDRRGVTIYHVGTVGIKHLLYSRLSTDADKEPEARLVRFTQELPAEFLPGLVSETYNPTKNRFEKKRGGARNEPLDTWGYGYAAAHHPELRLHRRTKVEWDAADLRIVGSKLATGVPGQAAAPVAPAQSNVSKPVPRVTHDDREFSI